ncbi:MAG: transketolase C-terminal domain-containing protein, partial [Sporomusa sp.]
EVILVTLGSVTGTARIVVDELRSQGKKAGLLKLRCIRPFPQDEVVAILKNAKAAGVLERDISFGYEGVVFTNVNSALTGLGNKPKTYNFVAGLGGRSISKSDIAGMFDKLFRQAQGKEQESVVEFVKLRCEDDGH